MTKETKPRSWLDKMNVNAALFFMCVMGWVVSVTIISLFILLQMWLEG